MLRHLQQTFYCYVRQRLLQSLCDHLFRGLRDPLLRSLRDPLLRSLRDPLLRNFHARSFWKLRDHLQRKLRAIRLVLSFFLLIMLSGCWNSNDIQDFLYVTALGIDYVDDQYYVYVQFVDFENLSVANAGTGNAL